MVEWTGTFRQFPFQEITREPDGHFTAVDSTGAVTQAFCQLLNQFGGKLWSHDQTCARTPSQLIASQQDPRHYHYTVQNWSSEDEKARFDQLYEALREARGTLISCNPVYSHRGLQAWLEIHTGQLHNFYDVYFIYGKNFPVYNHV